MKIYSFDDISQHLWESFVVAHPGCWFYHTARWIRIEASFRAVKNHSFAVVDNDGAILALCPFFLYEFGPERVAASGHHRHCGPVFSQKLTVPSLARAQSLVLHHVFQVAFSEHADRIILNESSVAPAYRERTSLPTLPQWLASAGFSPGMCIGEQGDCSAPGLSTVCADQIVFLDKTEEQLFTMLKESCRTAVRKARKSGVTLADVENPVNEYYRLACISAERTGEQLPNRSYYDALAEACEAAGNLHFLFAQAQGGILAALMLVEYKGTVNYSGGVCLPEGLPLCVNNFLHWEAIMASQKMGCDCYRLGPTFPENPQAWPTSKVSFFKGTFGGSSIPIAQATFFITPRKTLQRGIDHVTGLVAAQQDTVHKLLGKFTSGLGSHWRALLKEYGLAESKDLGLWRNVAGACILACGKQPACPPLRLLENPSSTLYNAGGPVCALASDAGMPLLRDASDCIAALLHDDQGRPFLFFGFDPFAEIIRRRQGDPDRVAAVPPDKRAAWGFPAERPLYLYEHMIVPEKPMEAWADHLGFLLAEVCAKLTNTPLLHVLPHGARGVLAITGDDDQAFPECYAEQLRTLGDTPITYFLHHLTRHTRQTVQSMPPHVAWGLHPDALDDPEHYSALCEEQCRAMEKLTGRKLRTVRNHGFLNSGYWGHAAAWERCGIVLDANIPGLDGTCYTGSYLPARLYGLPGCHTERYNLLTAFGDGMIFFGKNQLQAILRIRTLVRKIENGRAGVICCNLHPQNIQRTKWLHRYLRFVAHRRGWLAMTLEDLLDWTVFRNSLAWDGVGQCFVAAANKGGLHPAKVQARTYSASGWSSRWYPVKNVKDSDDPEKYC